MPHWKGQKILKLSKPHGAGPDAGTGAIGTGALVVVGATGTGAVGAMGAMGAMGATGTGAVGAFGTGAVGAGTGAVGTTTGLRTGLGRLGDALGRSVCYSVHK
jgi:hypothetical protein